MHPEESDDDEPDENEEQEGDGEDAYDDSSDTPSGKRHRSHNEARSPKRRKVDVPLRMTRDQRNEYTARLEKYWNSGTMHGQSASGTVYILATVLERVDNDLLWYVPTHFFALFLDIDKSRLRVGLRLWV